MKPRMSKAWPWVPCCGRLAEVQAEEDWITTRCAQEHDQHMATCHKAAAYRRSQDAKADPT